MINMVKNKNSQNRYGLAGLIRDQLSLPSWLPIEAEFQIGWEIELDLIPKRKYNLVWSKRIKDHYNTLGYKTHVIESPFIYHKNKNNYKQFDSAKGTVVFPYHSDEGWLVVLDINKFCSKLESLPKKFKPITICLHFLDYIDNNVKSEYEKYFNVVTAGDIYNKDFAQNFYHILSKNEFSTSNAISTYTFYSVDIGIPFFLTEGDFKTINRKSSNLEGVGSKKKIIIYPEYKKAFQLFKGMDRTIN